MKQRAQERFFLVRPRLRAIIWTRGLLYLSSPFLPTNRTPSLKTSPVIENLCLEKTIFGFRKVHIICDERRHEENQRESQATAGYALLREQQLDYIAKCIARNRRLRFDLIFLRKFEPLNLNPTFILSRCIFCVSKLLSCSYRRYDDLHT